MGSFMCIGYFSPIHGTDGLKSPKERLGNEDKAPCPRALLPGITFLKGVMQHNFNQLYKFMGLCSSRYVSFESLVICPLHWYLIGHDCFAETCTG